MGCSFNPCSYGSSVLTTKHFHAMRYVTWSFNPCSYGSSVLTKNDFFNQREIKKFQSLFLWIFRSYNNLLITFKSSTPSFNPCSYGSSVLTIDKIQINHIRSEVSILVLMDLSFLHRYRGTDNVRI